MSCKGLSLAGGLAALAIALAGCDVLFPEFAGSTPDAAIGDGGSVPDGGATGPHLAGSICALADLRDFRTCMTGHGGGFRVTVEETRDATTADASGNFVLPLARELDTATVAAIDPSSAAAPTIVTVALHAGAADGLALPVVSAQTLNQAAALNGFALDGAHGIVLAWAVDATGAPVAGASASTPGAASTGPFYEGAGTNELTFGNATGARGVFALFDLTAPTANVAVAAPANGAVKGDSFTLPVRPGAVTITTLLLPPKT